MNQVRIHAPAHVDYHQQDDEGSHASSAEQERHSSGSSNELSLGATDSEEIPANPAEVCRYPGVELMENVKSISHRCHLLEMEFVSELTK